MSAIQSNDLLRMKRANERAMLRAQVISHGITALQTRQTPAHNAPSPSGYDAEILDMLRTIGRVACALVAGVAWIAGCVDRGLAWRKAYKRDLHVRRETYYAIRALDQKIALPAPRAISAEWEGYLPEDA